MSPGGRGHLRDATLPSSACLSWLQDSMCWHGGDLPVPEVWPGWQLQTETVLASVDWLWEGASRLGKEQAFPRSW